MRLLDEVAAAPTQFIDGHDRHHVGMAQLEQGIHAHRLASGHLALPPLQLLLLLGKLDHLHHKGAFHGRKSDPAQNEEGEREASQEDASVAPANLESHILVGAQKTSSIERDHKIAQNDQRAIEHDLQSVQMAALVGAVQTDHKD